MKNNFLSKIKVVVIFSLLLVNTAFACINDRDTRFFERQRFPDIYQLMSGDFMTHDKSFYMWRISDRLKKIEKAPNNPAYYDDLSVAYEKTGQTKKAIELMEKVYAKYPNRYETIANLGTFYIHNQQYKKGLELLKKAVIINPDAHFGREIYQIKLVEYILKHNPDGKITFPVQKLSESFADYILEDIKYNDSNEEEFNAEYIDTRTTEILKAIVGVGGMLKFGNSDSPVLLEAMGDLYAELNSLNYQYITEPYTSTVFGKISSLFYVASITKGKLSDEVYNNQFYENKFNEYLEIKHIYTNFSFKELYSTLSEYEKKSKDKRLKHEDEIAKIITKGIDIENNIYNQIYSTPQNQENLLLTAKKQYLMILEESKYDYYDMYNKKITRIKDNFNESSFFLLFTIGLYSIVVLPSAISYFYRKYKNIELRKQHFSIKKYIRNITIIFFLYLIYNSAIISFYM